MSKMLKRKRKSRSEQQHINLFQQYPFAPSVQAPAEFHLESRPMVVTVTAYGAYQQPIEGWSALNAKLGGSIK